MRENSEPWSLRKKVLQDIIENEYYDLCIQMHMWKHKQ